MTIIKLRDRFSESEIDDEVVLMRLDNGEFFSLKGTGRLIWQLLDDHDDPGALSAVLADQFDISDAVLSQDVDAFLHALTDAGIVARA